MRNISSGNLALLQARRLVARDFIWLKVRTLAGAPFAYGFWNDWGDISAPVLNPDTGLPNTRNFEGSGSLIAIDNIPAVSNISVQNVNVALNQIDPAVENIARGYDMKQAGIEIYRGLFNPDTRLLVDSAFCRFVGFVDNVTITTPKENEAGSIELTCASHTQEMTRGNPDTRSTDSQKRRLSTDRFYEDVTTVGEKEFFWGAKQGKLDTKQSAAWKLKQALALKGS
ncbi:MULTISPECIES: hypothetical protein [unclassified Phyllobacterium]|uniref:hypothetical protein n=1 Tax=unclassified Phyllobacterium TaxID=2638441 RepID=UPI003012E0DC